MLRIAVPNKGSLADVAIEMLREAGYATRRDARELHVEDVRNDVEFFYLRPRDIATYVGSGALDVGITGRDLLLDSGSGLWSVNVSIRSPCGHHHEGLRTWRQSRRNELSRSCWCVPR
jgi:ATP phosphoribosyltransferase